MRDLEVGDTVMLKSGGPRMTVSRILNRGRVRCDWFDGQEPKFRTFDPDTLERVEDHG